MKTKYFMMAIAATLLAACNNDENEMPNGPVEARITAGIDGPATRAVDQDWTSNDVIGVMVTSSTSGMDNLYKNVKYTVSSAGKTGTFTAETGQGIFFQDAAEEVTFAAYYPYQASAANALPGTAGSISGDTQDQSTQAKQEALDFLYASGAKAKKSNPDVIFSSVNQFKHKMARLILVLQTSTTDGFTADQVTGGTYKLGGLMHAGTFNVTDGTATATGPIVNSWDITGNLKKDEAGSRTYTMILYPQELSSGALTFSVLISGQTYTCSINPKLESGNSYKYSITVKKSGLEVSGSTIDSWGVGGSSSGDAKME